MTRSRKDNNTETVPEQERESLEIQNVTQESSLTDLSRTQHTEESIMGLESEHKNFITENFLELDQNEIALLFRILEVSPKEKIADQIDRLYRCEIRKVLGPDAAPWDDKSDSIVDPFPLPGLIPKRDMLVRTFMKDKENPDSTIAKHLCRMAQSNNSVHTKEVRGQVTLPSEGVGKSCSLGAIPKKNKLLIVDDQNFTPSENSQIEENSFIPQNNRKITDQSRRATFIDTGRGASSPLPRASSKGDNYGDRERTNQTTQRPLQYLDTPEISRVPSSRTTRERIIITDE